MPPLGGRAQSRRIWFEFRYAPSRGPGPIKEDKSIGFGSMDVTKPYKSIGFGSMDVTKPYKSIVFGSMGCHQTL